MYESPAEGQSHNNAQGATQAPGGIQCSSGEGGDRRAQMCTGREDTGKAVTMRGTHTASAGLRASTWTTHGEAYGRTCVHRNMPRRPRGRAGGYTCCVAWTHTHSEPW